MYSIIWRGRRRWAESAKSGGGPAETCLATLGCGAAPKGLSYSSSSDRRRMMRSGRIGELGGRPTPYPSCQIA